MIVTPVPFERARFWVSSERPNTEPYLVDFDHRDEKWSRPCAVCGCPDCFCKGFKPCKHIWRIVDYLNHKSAMKVRISPFVRSFAASNRTTVEELREKFSGVCVEFAGELCERVPGSRLAYFDNLRHPAWKYHAAMVFDGWVHDLWYPLFPIRLFMLTIGASTIEYPAEEVDNT